MIRTQRFASRPAILTQALPNFSRYYNFDNTGLFPVGLRIPTAAEDFIADYTGEFGEAPTLTAGELAIIERAASAPPQAFLPGRTFSITSPYGVVALGDFGTAIPLGSEPDLDGNGTSDCLQSFTGYNSSLDGAGSFGAAGGCWFINENGVVTPYEDGLVSDNFNQFGARQSYIAPETPYVLPQYERYSINVNGHYTFDPRAEAFWETGYVYGNGSPGAVALTSQTRHGAPQSLPPRFSSALYRRGEWRGFGPRRPLHVSGLG